MKKKVIIIAIIIAVLALGKVAYDTAKRYFAYKMIGEIVLKDAERLLQNGQITDILGGGTSQTTQPDGTAQPDSEDGSTQPDGQEDGASSGGQAAPSNGGNASEPSYDSSFVGPTQPPKKTGSFMDDDFVREIAARFSAAEIAEATALTADGITAEEKQRLKAIVYSKVSSGEIAKLKELYNEYNSN